MRKVILLTFLMITGYSAICQTSKIDKKDIWRATFSTNPDLDSQGMLTRKVTKEGKELIYKTSIEKIQYYKSKLVEKCCVIFSNCDFTDYMNGKKDEFVVCGKEWDVAQFIKKGNIWVLEKFLPAFYNHPQGNLGNGDPSVSIEMYKGKKCILFTRVTMHRGNSDTVTDAIFNLETLKPIE